MAELERPLRPRSRGDFSQQISHFFRMVLKRKWVVLTFGLLAAGGMLSFLLSKGFIKPELEAKVVFGLEGAAQWDSYNEYGDIGAYRVEGISSRAFLTDVAKNLSLQLTTPGLERARLFDSLRLDSSVNEGSYSFRFDNAMQKQYAIIYKGNGLIKKHVIVGRGSIDTPRAIATGLTLFLTERFRNSPGNFSFHVSSLDEAVDNLLKKMTVTLDARRDPDHFSVNLRGGDYGLTATTLNVIASSFVRKNSMVRRQRTRERIVILEKQLDQAKFELAASESSVRRFLQEHPLVGLDSRDVQAVSNIASIQTQSQAIGMDIEQVQRLRDMYRQSASDTAHPVQVVGEMLAFLQTKGVPNAVSLREELLRLETTQTSLKQNYMEGHPLIKQNNEKIKAVGIRAYRLIDEMMSRLQQQQAQYSSEVRGLAAHLRDLPRLSMQLAELRRKQEINSLIYSNLQSRYNEARVSDAAALPDVFLIDVASEPMPPPLVLRLVRIIALVLIAGLLAGLAPVIFMDIIDKTALTEFEVNRITPIPVLESVPVIRYRLPRGNYADG